MTDIRTRANAGSAPRGAAVFAVVIASLFWGTTGTAATFMPESVSPLAIGAVTMGVGGVVLMAIGGRRSIAAIRDAAARRWLLIGAIGVVVYPLAFYSGMDLAGVAIGNVVALGVGPVFAAIIEWIIDRRRPGRAWAIATSGAVAGIVLLTVGGHGSDGPVDPASVPLGVALALLAGIAYALFSVAAARAIQAGHASTPVMGAMFGLGSIGLLPVLLLLGAPILASPLSIGIAAYLVIGPMVIAYIAFGIGVRSLSASTATTVALLEPAIATLLAVIVVGERLEALGWIGLALIVAAVVVIGSASRQRET